MKAVLVALVALARVAHADTAADLAAIERAAPTCDPARAHCFGIQLHVAAADDAALVATPAWLATQLAGANRHFAAIGVGFELAGLDALPIAAAHIATRHERDALAARLGHKVIDVFITARLDDVDLAGAIAYGVTWHAPDDDRKFVIVSTEALERTLAHELGHVFGLPHSTYAISIMNKSERDEPPVEQRTFADEELTVMRRSLRRFLRDKRFAEHTR